MGLTKDKQDGFIFFCLIVTYVSFGMVYLMIKFALDSFPPIILSALRYFLAGSIYLFWSYIVKKERTVPTLGDFRIMVIVACGMMIIKGGFLIYSEKFIPSGAVAVLLGTTPMWMVLLGWLLFKEEKPAFITWAGLLAGLVGVIIITYDIISQDKHGSYMSFGIILAALSVVGGVLGSLYSKKRKTQVRITTSFGYQMIFAALVFFAVALIIGEFKGFSLSQVTLKSWLSLAGLVIFGSLSGFAAYLWLLYNAPSGLATSYSYVEPVLAVIAGVIFAGEHLTFSLACGCILIAISVFIIIIRRDSWHHHPV